MKSIFVFIGFTFTVFFVCHEAKASFTNFDVRKYELCNNTQLAVKYVGHIIKEHGEQYLTHNLTLPFPLGDNIGLDCLIETKTIGNTFVELFTIRERNICKAFNKYLGEFWYDLERHSQIAAGVCPIQQGRYYGNHVLVNFEKITLQTFPFGRLRFTMKGVDNNSKIAVWCLFIEVDNVVN